MTTPEDLDQGSGGGYCDPSKGYDDDVPHDVHTSVGSYCDPSKGYDDVGGGGTRRPRNPIAIPQRDMTTVNSRPAVVFTADCDPSKGYDDVVGPHTARRGPRIAIPQRDMTTTPFPRKKIIEWILRSLKGI
ncbi:hypothetical protein FAGKG844_290070 [Frankia sp. AgKG'84/4]